MAERLILPEAYKERPQVRPVLKERLRMQIALEASHRNATQVDISYSLGARRTVMIVLSRPIGGRHFIWVVTAENDTTILLIKTPMLNKRPILGPDGGRYPAGQLAALVLEGDTLPEGIPLYHAFYLDGYSEDLPHGRFTVVSDPTKHL